MENSVRIERINRIPSYDAAFDHLTNFYKRRKISHDRPSAMVVDLTGDDHDSSAEPDDGADESRQDTDTSGDPGEALQRASGVPCMSYQPANLAAEV
jgi:hypothetical protein